MAHRTLVVFTDRLKLQLALTVGSDAFTIEGGAVTAVSLDATTYGFEGRVSFVVSSEQEADPLFARFVTRDLIRVSLTLTRQLEDGSSDEAALPVNVVGYVADKTVAEVIAPSLQGAPVIERVYGIHFFDPARIFWGEHHPVELHAEVAVGEILALHKAAGMTLAYDWLRLTEKQDVLCLPLEAERGASFYDFVAWYIDRFDGVLELDAASGTYRFGGSKTTPKTNLELDMDDVADVAIDVAEPPRHTVHVLNTYADAAVRDAPVPNTDAVTGVRWDVLERTPISAAFDRRVSLEAGRLRAGEHGIEVTFKKFPEQLPTPNLGMVLEDRFSAALFPASSKYRATELHLTARATRPIAELDVEDPGATFEMEMSLRAEAQGSRTRHLPDFRRPVWPVEVEGRVTSASGEDGDRTWFTTANEKDSIFQYRVLVPLWNKTIVAPFAPDHMTGHFFFPAYKAQRVLLGLGFDSAAIVGYLDWADNAKLSRDTQGNAIALGYKDGNGTLIRHQYEDGKPALQIQRKLGGDQETFAVTEGVIRFEVKEDPLVPTVEPKFDVTAQVEGAKAEVASEVNGAVTLVTGKFETSSGAVQSSLDDATGEVSTAVTAAATTLSAKVDAAEAQLQALGASAGGAVAVLAAKVSDAKAALQSALSG